MGKLPHMWGQSLYILGSLMAEVRLQSYPTFYLFICLSHHMIRFAMNSLNSNDIFFLLYFDVIITFLPSLQHGGYGQCLTKNLLVPGSHVHPVAHSSLFWHCTWCCSGIKLWIFPFQNSPRCLAWQLMNAVILNDY